MRALQAPVLGGKDEGVTRVRLHRLAKAELNGCEGERHEWDSASSRWLVRLDCGREVRVKPSKMSVIDADEEYEKSFENASRMMDGMCQQQ